MLYGECYYKRKRKKESEEKDLGIIIDDKLKFQNHISKQILKANGMLGLIKRTFKHMDS